MADVQWWPESRDTCDKCGQPSDALAFVHRDGYDFLCPACRFLPAPAPITSATQIDWTALGKALRQSANDAHPDEVTEVVEAYGFLLYNPECFTADESETWPADMPQKPNTELVAAYYGYRKVAVRDLRQGDRVDLEGDPFADPARDHVTFQFEWSVVDQVEEETPGCWLAQFEDGFACGFPPDHVVTIDGDSDEVIP